MVNGMLFDYFTVSNDLRQSCTMAPTLFNLYASIIADRWLDNVKGMSGVET